MGHVISTVQSVPYYAQWASAHLVEGMVTGRIPASEDPAWADYGATTTTNHLNFAAARYKT